MGDYLVDDRLVRFDKRARIGDCPDARVVFPGAALSVARAGSDLMLRGRSLAEGKGWRMSLGNIEVCLENVPLPTKARTTGSMFDGRFLATALIVVGIGSWMDAAEHWITRQPVTHTMHRGDVLKRLTLRVQDTATQQRTAGVQPTKDWIQTNAVRDSRLADGPRHAADDRISRTGYYQWYRRIVPSDSMARDANDRLLFDPKDVAARRIVARAAYNADHFDMAAWHYQILLDLDPMDGGLLTQMAMAERRRGHHQNEIALYRRILTTNGESTQALQGLTTALARMGHLDDAAMVLDHLEMIAPTDPYTELSAATIASIAGEKTTALQALDRAISTRSHLRPALQIELRRDIALDPAFAALRKDNRLRAVLRRHLGAAAPRPMR